MKRFASLIVVLLIGCSEGSSTLTVGADETVVAALHLTLTDSTLTTGGEYEISIQDNDGTDLGFTGTVDFAAGEQSVRVEFRDESLLANADVRQVRVCVKAKPNSLANPTQIGGIAAEFRRDETVLVDVPMLADPKPTTAQVLMRYTRGTTGLYDQVAVALVGVAPTESRTWHLWLADGTESPTQFMGNLSTDTVSFLPLPSGTDPGYDQDLTFAITLEPADIVAPLGRCGWETHAGGLDPALSDELRAALVQQANGCGTTIDCLGIVPAALRLQARAQTHMNFAENAFNGGAEAGVIDHSEHVHNTIAGQLGGKSFATDDNSAIEFPEVFDPDGSDDTFAITGVNSYKSLLDGYLTLGERQDLTDGGNVAQTSFGPCLLSMETAAQAVISSALNIETIIGVQSQTTAEAAADFATMKTSVAGILGEVTDSSSSGLECVRALLEGMGQFELTAAP